LVEKKSRGAQDGFNQEDIAPFLVPLPPLEEQQRIVAILDEALEGLARARTHAEANLQDARELFESIKANALDYNGPDRKTVVLCDVAEVTSGLVDPREAAYADMPHIGAGNMITGSDELVGVMTAREEKLISGKYLFDETMVLYSKIRPYLRKAARPDFGGLCSADVYPVKPVNAGLDRDFLFHLLLGHDFTEYAIQGSDRAGMPKVNRNHMFAYSFDLPPLEEQQKIAKVIDAAHIECQQLAELANAKLQSLDALRQSLLQKAFAGELT
jgi:type I restriction enzyme S subunit